MPKKRAKKGRPRKRHPFSERLGIAVRPVQKSRYIDASDAAGLDLSEWVRAVLDREADRVLGDNECT